MRGKYTRVILLCCVNLCLGKDNSDPSATEDDLAPDHSRVTRQLDSGTGVSILAVAAFGAFLMYVIYFHITKYLQSGRALEENMFDLTRIMTCLEKEEFTPDLHLHCFFPAFFSRADSVSLSKRFWETIKPLNNRGYAALWVQEEEDDAAEKTVIEDIRELTRKKARGFQKIKSSGRHRVKRQLEGGNFISLLAVAAFGSFLFYSLYFHISKYLQKRSLESNRIEDYMREMTRVLLCLQDENFVPRLECFIESPDLTFRSY